MYRNCFRHSEQFLYTTCSPHVLQKEELLIKIYLYSALWSNWFAKTGRGGGSFPLPLSAYGPVLTFVSSVCMTLDGWMGGWTKSSLQNWGHICSRGAHFLWRIFIPFILLHKSLFIALSYSHYWIKNPCKADYEVPKYIKVIQNSSLPLPIFSYIVILFHSILDWSGFRNLQSWFPKMYRKSSNEQ